MLFSFRNEEEDVWGGEEGELGEVKVKVKVEGLELWMGGIGTEIAGTDDEEERTLVSMANIVNEEGRKGTIWQF